MILSKTLKESEWKSIAKQHKAQVLEFTTPYRKRRSQGESHPILDFLFTYYSYPAGRLESWHPRLSEGIELKTETPPHYKEIYYSRYGTTLFLDKQKLPPERKKSMLWMIELLEKTQNSPPIHRCFGMHEWAMVYQGQKIRHEKTAPLRLSQAETDCFVESHPIQCSHFDAYRFFTPSAKKFNRLQPTIDKRVNFEQSGCIHANMDIYKWAYKCMPWVGSEFLWKTFKNALDMRELDMRAAPYDLSEFNLDPIKVETSDGRQQYQSIQKKLAEKSKPLRSELIKILRTITSADTLS